MVRDLFSLKEFNNIIRPITKGRDPNTQTPPSPDDNNPGLNDHISQSPSSSQNNSYTNYSLQYKQSDHRINVPYSGNVGRGGGDIPFFNPFKPDPNYVIRCMFCDNVFNARPSTLLKHLATISCATKSRGIQTAPCPLCLHFNFASESFTREALREHILQRHGRRSSVT